MRQQSALWPPRCSRSVDDQHRHFSVEINICDRFRTGIGEGLLVTIIVRAIERKIMLNRNLSTQSLNYRGKLIFVDKDLGLAVFQDILQFRLSKAVIKRDQNSRELGS